MQQNEAGQAPIIMVHKIQLLFFAIHVLGRAMAEIMCLVVLQQCSSPCY